MQQGPSSGAATATCLRPPLPPVSCTRPWLLSRARSCAAPCMDGIAARAVQLLDATACSPRCAAVGGAAGRSLLLRLWFAPTRLPCTGVPYLDVCDDTDYSQRAKALHERAAAAGVPAITTAGIYPGGLLPCFHVHSVLPRAVPSVPLACPSAAARASRHTGCYTPRPVPPAAACQPLRPLPPRAAQAPLPRLPRAPQASAT